MSLAAATAVAAVILTAIGMLAAAFRFCAKGIVFFATLNTNVEKLTETVKAGQADAKKIAKEFQEAISEHHSRLEVVEKMLDLDDRAQSVIREKIRQARIDERRVTLRRDRDRVNEEVRDVLDKGEGDE